MQCIGNVPKTCAANNGHGHPACARCQFGGPWWAYVWAEYAYRPQQGETCSSDKHAKLALPATAMVMSPTMRQMSICWPHRKNPFKASLKFTRAAAG